MASLRFAALSGPARTEDASTGPGLAADWVAVAGVHRATAASARSQTQEERLPRVCAGATPDGDLRPCGSNSRHQRCLAPGHDQLRRGAPSAVVQHRTQTAEAGYVYTNRSATSIAWFPKPLHGKGKVGRRSRYGLKPWPGSLCQDLIDHHRASRTRLSSD